MAAMTLRSNAGELHTCVVHVKSFVMQNLFENCARRRIVLHHVAINGEPAGRRFLR